jgi:hypothetical protein
VFASSLTGALVPAPTPTTEEPEPVDPLAGVVPGPEDVTGVTQGGIVSFTWTNPDPEEGDTYIWYEVTLDGPGEPHIVEQANATLEGERTGRTCIEVLIKRADGRSTPEGVRGCVG